MDIRYHLDENAHAAIADGLRRRAIDVTTSEEAGLVSATDEQQLAYAVSQGRVVVTHDPDFLRFAAAGREHPGIVFSASGVRSIGELVRGLVRLFFTRTAEEMHNRVEYL